MSFSIVIPFFNAIDCLKDALDSIYNQQYSGDYEVILIDDGSNDGSYELAFSESKKHSNLKLLSNKSLEKVVSSPDGPGFARNIGLDIARFDYVVFLDSDDLLVDGALNILENNLSKGDIDCAIYACGGGQPFRKIHYNINE